MRNRQPKLARIAARTYRAVTDHMGRVIRLEYTGNQNRPGWVYHPTKGWRRSRKPATPIA